MTWEEAELIHPGCSADFDSALSLEDHPQAHGMDELYHGGMHRGAEVLRLRHAAFADWWIPPTWIYLLVEEPGGRMSMEWRFHRGVHRDPDWQHPPGWADRAVSLVR